MISQIRLRNFKAARSIVVKAAPLTVLAGMNGSGKSTILQSLSALKQSTIPVGGSGLRLRGQLAQLGTFGDVFTEGGETEGIGIGVTERDRDFDWEFSESNNPAVLQQSASPDQLPEFLTQERFQLLPADRLVPRDLFSRATSVETDQGFLGPKGEFVVEFLVSEDARRIEVSANRTFPKRGIDISPGLLAKAAPTSGLIDQVSGWLQQLSPGVRITADELANTDELMLRFGYVGRVGVGESSRMIRPANVGFGLTYCLPIVVACLAAKPGTLLLLENPEAHLHPQGQAALGELLVKAASDGVQILVETHSDHVLNGIRVSVKSGLARGSDVAINYFRRIVETGFSELEYPELNDKGKLSSWPRGFFDQFEQSLSEL